MKTVPFALPSYVIPADTKKNILFLLNKTPEIALLCFEPSLPKLTDLTPFKGSWHIHLPYLVPHGFYDRKNSSLCENPAYPADTVWEDCWKHAASAAHIEALAKACVQITRHCKPLNPHACVMHLPHSELKNAEEFLGCFLHTWQKELPLQMLCLENVRKASYFDYAELLLNSPCSLCFDTAHALTYGQTDCLDNHAFMQKVRIVHWSAPFEENTLQYGQDKHLNLNHLKNHTDYCIKTLKSISADAVHVLELFSWEEIEKSLPFLFRLLSQN